jgi:hypothetical protein
MTKMPGESPRDSIALLLRMKFQNVIVEKRLSTTTADVFFIDDTNALFPRSIAIEAKDWGRKLTSENIAEIFTLYAPALAQNEIDNLWIIGQHSLSGSPRLSLDSLTKVRYSTLRNFARP